MKRRKTLAEKNSCPVKRTTIGGQALIEGIMMKGPFRTAMAVRTKTGEIVTEEKDAKPKKWYNKAPFIRGTINFVTQLSEGYTYLSRSAELSGMAETADKAAKVQKTVSDVFERVTGFFDSVGGFFSRIFSGNK